MTVSKMLMATSAALIAISGGNAAFAGGVAPEPAPVPVVPVEPAPQTDWSGFYVGGAVGMGSANYDISGGLSLGFDGPDSPGQDLPGDLFDLAANLPDLGGEGGIGRLQLGYRHQFGSNFVLGGQLDATFGDITNDTSVSLFAVGDPDINADFDYELTAEQEISFTLRAGYLVNPRTQIYALAGMSRGTFTGEGNLSIDGDSESFSYDFELDGHTFGAGIETRLAGNENISIGAEYRYTNYEDYNFFNVDDTFGFGDGPPLNVRADLGFETSVQTASVFINFNF